MILIFDGLLEHSKFVGHTPSCWQLLCQSILLMNNNLPVLVLVLATNPDEVNFGHSLILLHILDGTDNLIFDDECYVNFSG